MPTVSEAMTTYLVLEAGIGPDLLRPFPKHNGVVVKVHSREHPPPNIHVEMPPGKEVTRCEWPSLEPGEGDRSYLTISEPNFANTCRDSEKKGLRQQGFGDSRP